ncbi:hypothetical protein IGI04_030648 [Brassica rapa subsp. trilocularis]|uniref:Uncharacterized protein n=1 Tax=Brassica rapa subsp. trilocularis TaxID=1813537 RepID=A0ABQ7LRE8_BRACM|nr:hypothetical protein IGI04_030648 [Brassica rapa subsp. trilocularis]
MYGVGSIDVERGRSVDDEGQVSVDGWVRESVNVKAAASIDVFFLVASGTAGHAPEKTRKIFLSQNGGKEKEKN